jgi:hypothetical protein
VLIVVVHIIVTVPNWHKTTLDAAGPQYGNELCLKYCMPGANLRDDWPLSGESWRSGIELAQRRINTRLRFRGPKRLLDLETTAGARALIIGSWEAGFHRGGLLGI